MNKPSGWKLALLSIAVVGAVVSAQALRRSGNDETRFNETKVERRSIEDSLISKGVFGYLRQVSIRSPGTGRLEVGGMPEGTLVKKGQVIARIVDYQLQADLANIDLDLRKAELRLSDSQRDLDALQKLESVGAVAKYEVLQKLSELSLAKSELERVQVERARLKSRAQIYDVRAPLNGVISTTTSVKDQRIAGGDELYSIAGGGGPYVFVYIDAADATRVKLGTKATFSAVEDDPEKIEGTVTEIASAVTTGAKPNTLRITVTPGQARANLKVSQQLYVELRTNFEQDAIVIPREYIIERGPKQFTLVKKDGRFAEREIEAKTGNSQMEIVTAGLGAGDVIGKRIPAGR